LTAADAVRGVVPRRVVEPTSAAEVAAVLREANEQGLAVIPRGGGTKRDWGNRPARADLLLSTARLNRIVEHPWADLTVTVEAGCTIRALQDALRVHGQRIAADPLWPDTATVGGALSANDTGALRLRFGGWRDLVIGTTLALPDGTLASSGGKVVKNVAGYDLSKLATGALGTLGVITTAIFRLHPLPHQSRTLSATVSGIDHAQRVILALQDSKLAYTSLQARLSSTAAPEIDVLFEGTAAGIEAQVRDARRIAEEIRLDDGPMDVWTARQALWTGDRTGPVLKFSVLLTELAGTLQHVQRVAGMAAVEWTAVFQATGAGWVSFSGPPADWPDVVRGLRRGIESQSGSLVILRPISDEDSTDVWGDPGDAGALMRAVKREFDPRQTLNPGRYVGGI
jgi:glycolate oxidase FAD binding subunit